MAVNGGIAYLDQATTKVMVTNATGTLRRAERRNSAGAGNAEGGHPGDAGYVPGSRGHRIQPERTVGLRRGPSGHHHDPDADQSPKGPAPTLGPVPQRPRSRPVTVRAGQPLRFDPTIVAVAPSTGAPAGTISYTDHHELSHRELGTAVYDVRRLKSANGRITATFGQPGKHRITASYQGNDSFTASRGTLTVEVTTGDAPQPGPVAPGGT